MDAPQVQNFKPSWERWSIRISCMSTSAFLPIAYALVCERRWIQTSPAAARSSTHKCNFDDNKNRREDNCDILLSSSRFEESAGCLCVRLKWNNRGWLLWRRWKHRSEPQTAFKWPLFVNAMNLVLQEGTEYSCLMRRVGAQRSQDCCCLWLCVHLYHVLFSHMELMVNESSDTSLWCLCWDQSVADAIFLMRPLNLLINKCSSLGNGFLILPALKQHHFWCATNAWILIFKILYFCFLTYLASNPFFACWL